MSKNLGDPQHTTAVPRLMVTGLRPDAGVSSLFLSFLEVFKSDSKSVGCGKVGFNLVDSAHQRRVLGRFCATFDPVILDKKMMQDSFYRLAGGAELVLVEGSNFHDFDAQVASVLHLPVVLVLVRSELEREKELLREFHQKFPQIRIAGIILNQPTSEGMIDSKLEKSFEADLMAINIPILAKIGFQESVLNRPRFPDNQSLLQLISVNTFSKYLRKVVNFEELYNIAKNVSLLQVAAAPASGSSRISAVAIADDPAFSLLVQDNLDLLRKFGVLAIPFSPMIDSKVPLRAKAIYFPSGFISSYIKDLSNNKLILSQIKDYAEAGGQIYAEGSGFAFLCEEIVLQDGKSFSGVGIFPAVAKMRLHVKSPVENEIKLENKYYISIETAEDSFFGEPNQKLSAVYPCDWEINFKNFVGIKKIFKITAAEQLFANGNELPQYEETEEGFLYKNSLGTKFYAHWGTNTQIARNFMMSTVG